MFGRYSFMPIVSRWCLRLLLRGRPWLTVLTCRFRLTLWRYLPWPFPRGLSSDVAGAASLAVAEVASSADTAGVTSSADLAGMSFPAVAGVASPADLAGMSLPAIVGVASLTDLAGMVFPVVAGAAPLAFIELVSLTHSMVVAGSPSVCNSQCVYDCLVPDDYVTE